MQRLVNWSAKIVSHHPSLTAVALVVLTLILSVFAAQQELSSENEDFLPDSKTSRALDTIEQDFSSSTTDIAQVIVESENLLDPASLQEVLRLEESIRSDSSLAKFLAYNNDAENNTENNKQNKNQSVFSYADILSRNLEPGTSFETVSAEKIEEIFAALPPPMAAQFEGMTAETKAPGDVTAGLIFVSFDSTFDRDDLSDIHLELRDLVDTYNFNASTGSTLATGLIFEAMEESQESMGGLFGLALLLILGILILLYRSVSDVVLGMIGLVMTVIWMYGLGVLAGPDYLGLSGTFNNMTIIIPVLLIGLAIDYAIHNTSRYREEIPDTASPQSAMEPALRSVGSALVLATVTTSVGFLTNIFSPLPPMQDFGIFAALGVIAAWIVMTTFVPSMRILIDGRRIKRGKKVNQQPVADAIPGASRVLTTISDFTESRPWRTIGAFGLITIVSLGAAVNISTEFNMTDFLPKDSAVYRNANFLEDNFANSGESATVLVRGDFADPSLWTALQDFESKAGTVEGTSSPIRSFASLAKDWGTSDPNQADDQFDKDVEKALADINAGKANSLKPLYQALAAVDAPGLAQQVHTDSYRSGIVNVPISSTVDADVLRDGLYAAAKDLNAQGFTIVPTSPALTIDEVTDSLQSSQVGSIIATILAAGLILSLYFGITFRHPVLGLLLILPVALVIAWVLGSMSILGISFNVMTAMITSLTIGIGVPYSTHIVNRFLEDVHRYPEVKEALHSTIKHTGGALLGSALTTILGFGVLLFAPMVPMRQFGGLTALTIGYSLITSIMVLPPVLVIWDRQRRKKQASVSIETLQPQPVEAQPVT